MTDAPEKIFIHHAGLIDIDGSSALVFKTCAPINFIGSQTEYTRIDIANARIAELEAANDDLRERYKAFACWAERKLSGIKTEEDPCSPL
jgi:hypothetical protein